MSLPVHAVPALVGVEPGSVVVVEGDEAHHAVAVRRLRTGERVVLTDGRGRQVVGAVAQTGRRRFEVVAASVSDRPPPQPRVTVVQAIAKGDRSELAVELLTEAGADQIVPWAAARSVARWSGERADRALARWRSTAREAGKQSRRAWFPDVTDPVTTDGAARLAAGADLAVVLHEGADSPLAAVTPPAAGSLLLVVGPEGGISEAELASFEAAGATACRLGPEVLRTSTAGALATALLLSRTPRWR